LKIKFRKFNPSGKIENNDTAKIIGWTPANNRIINMPEKKSKKTRRKSGKDFDHCLFLIFSIRYSIWGKKSKK